MIDADSKEFLRRMLEVNTPALSEFTLQGARDISKRFEKKFLLDPKAEAARDLRRAFSSKAG